MSERKIVVEFTVKDEDRFHASLQRWSSLPETTIVGYRADDSVGRREALTAFVNHMELKLRKNDHKKNWREKPIEALHQLMLLELKEFEVALEFFTIEEAKPELVDVANFAMILWDRLGMMDQQSMVGVDKKLAGS